MTYEISKLLNAWRLAALDEWACVVRDTPDDFDRISGYFRSIGWGFHIAAGYRNTEKYAWCGVFAGAMGLRIGDHLEPDKCVPVALDYDVARVVMPSTFRLQSRAKWEQASGKMPVKLGNSGLAPLAIEDLRPGMVCTIAARDYGDRRNDYGGHVVIVDNVRPAEGLVDTVEGNAHGELGDGAWGEGVVRRRGEHARPFDNFRRAYLLDPATHFETLGG